MRPKKTIVITFRTDEETKDLLELMSSDKEWSISQVVEKICKEYFKKGVSINMNTKEAILEYYSDIIKTIDGAEYQCFGKKEIIEIIKEEAEKKKDELIEKCDN